MDCEVVAQDHTTVFNRRELGLSGRAYQATDLGVEISCHEGNGKKQEEGK